MKVGLISADAEQKENFPNFITGGRFDINLLNLIT